MTFYDGMGTYLRIWSDGTWLFISTSMKIHTLVISYLVYAVIGLSIIRYRRKKNAVA